MNGRKRHLAVDKLGLPLAISVSAADVHDSMGGYDLLWGQVKKLGIIWDKKYIC